MKDEKFAGEILSDEALENVVGGVTGYTTEELQRMMETAIQQHNSPQPSTRDSIPTQLLKQTEPITALRN